MALAPAAAEDPGAAPADDTDTAAAGDTGADEQQQSAVLVTICKTADGYMVYAGDEAEEPGEGAEPGERAPDAEPQGQPADSIGAALKAALDILQGDESDNGGGNAALEDGFSGQGALAAPANPPGA